MLSYYLTMKKTLFFLSIFAILGSCSSSKKKKNDSTFLKGFKTYYNTLYNSKDALNTELSNRKNSFKDNYYAPYIQLLKFDEQPLGTEFGTNDLFNDNDAPKGLGNQNPNQAKGASALQIAEAKALKAIDKYSVMKKGEEKNKKIFDAYILLAQSRIYQNKPLEALEALNTVFSDMRKDKRLPLAKIYQGQALAKMGDFYRSAEVFRDLKDDPKLKKQYQKLLSVYYSEMLLHSGKKEAAVAELEDAFKLNKNREMRSRIAFLRGQILAELGKNEEARESFVSAYKYANNFEFEVKSQIEIAKTFNGSADDYEGAKEYLERISKKGTYGSRKNEFYYALGLMAKKAGNIAEADSFFNRSLKEKISDPQIRGLDYYEIGKSFFDKSDYLSAGAYYDSALSTMTYEPSKVLIKEQTAHIKQVTANYYLVKKNDSILALAKMTPDQKTAYFTEYINKLKAKEAEEELAKKREERSKGFDDGDYSANSIFANNTGGFQDFSDNGNKGGFYFANQSTISKGEANFKQVWGNRSLADNWRSSARSSSIEDMKNEALGLGTAPDPRRHDPAFYIEKIPTDLAILDELKKDRDTASLGLGRMYDEYFSDTKLATKTLYDLVDVKPVDDVKLPALYQIFVMNYEKNPSAAERAKQIILSDYPYTSYAEFVKNPKNNNFNQSSDDVVKAYSDAFDLYKNDKFDESKVLIAASLEKYPKDAMVPKFELLNAFNTGKTVGKEIMILQLEQIALNYAKKPEGIKAAEMLKFLKSDLKIEMTDDSGNAIQNNKTPNNNTSDNQKIKEEKNAENNVENAGDLKINSGPGLPGANDIKEVEELQPQKKKKD